MQPVALHENAPKGADVPEKSIGLAPMEGVTELATRLWFCLTSAPKIAGTPFFRVTSTFPVDRISALFAPELQRLKKLVSYKLIPQVMTPDPVDFIRVAEHLLIDTDFVDLNCGCPSPTVVGGGSGSSLLVTPERFGSFAQKITTALGPARVSIKMRVGFSHPSEFNALLAVLPSMPLAQLTIHGRTRDERYSGRSRWDLIDSASRTLPFPVIGSGDIVDEVSLREQFSNAPLVAGAIVGRGALRNPWIFSSLAGVPPQSMSVTCLTTSLAVFAALQTAYLENPASLFEMAEKGLFLKPLGLNEDDWINSLEVITKLASGQSIKSENLALPPKILSRTKMIWNHLRGSLPDPLFDGGILRATSFNDFITAITHKIRAASDLDPQQLPLRYNPRHDWIFSGTRRQT